MLEETTHVIALYGRYDGITMAMRVVIDGTIYDVTGVRGDGQGITTYLGARVVHV